MSFSGQHSTPSNHQAKLLHFVILSFLFSDNMDSASDGFVVVTNKKKGRKARQNNGPDQVGFSPDIHLSIDMQLLLQEL